MLKRILLSLCLLLPLASRADPLSPEQVPEPLKPWVEWVLQDTQQLDCPYQYNQAQRRCSWPSQLQLLLSDNGGTFSQQWQVYEEMLIRLPGDGDYWPQNVQSDQGELLVQSVKGMPYVKLSAGTHRVRGLFRWNKLPKSLPVAPESGLIELQLNGKRIQQPQFNQQGQLWLTQSSGEVLSEDNLDIQVFRKIIDSHPIQVVTQIKLRVSGKQRNTTLSPVLLDGLTALSISSTLPARIENKQGKKQLQVQLRPGEWTLEVTGRAPTDITEFTSPPRQQPWPDQEVWVFQADPNLRQVQVTGVNSIDPNQTQLSGNWKSLPAYLLMPGKTLSLDVMHRGATQIGRDTLALKREMWLDYDGNGYTFKDTLSGTAQQQSRLNVRPEIELGRVSIDGQDQFITREANAGESGVEIRRDQINLNAESRFTGDRSAPPVSGWQHDLQQVSTTLHIPPGWRLLSTSGADNLPASWVTQWSLLDFFLVLIIALSVAYLYGGLWGGFALLTLILTWHEPNAPRYIWLNLLAAIALLKVLPDGWFKRAMNGYRWMSLLALVLFMLPYTVDTIRTGLYPQLDNRFAMLSLSSPSLFSNLDSDSDQVMMEQAEHAMPVQAPMVQSRVLKKMSDSSYATGMVQRPAPKPKSPADLQAIDPNSMIQTGPGLPDWRGYQQVRLEWSGPVKSDETSYLLLINPWMNMLMKFAGIALLLGLSWRLLSLSKGFSWNPKQWFKRGIASVLAVLLLPLLLSTHEPAQAETIPDPAMLAALKERLTRAPDCLPECAQIEQMQISIADNALQARLRVHAVIETAIPLPGSQDTWLSQRIVLNGEPALAIQRDASQQLWVAVPQGQSDLVLSGPLPTRNSVPLPLPLKPHSVSWQSSDKGWTLDGVKDNGSTESQLQINRILSKDDKALQEQEQSILPAFVKIERHLNIGLDWTVDTTVTRLAPLNTPLSLSIPLLANEQPMSEQLSINDQHIKINLNAQQREASWSSRLTVSEQLVLKATSSTDFLETWQVATSPVWHLDSSGIPVNQYRNQANQTIPVWYPWPGETLNLSMTRPEGIAGQTVTLLSSNTKITTGKRATDVTLTLNILSSRGVLHTIKLPETAELQQVKIDGVAQRIQRTGNALSLSLKPGKQNVVVEWREAQALGTSYEFPAIDLGLPSVNARFEIGLPADRWILWVDGPAMGPAILFWGVLLALLIVSFALAAAKLTPLKTWQWFLLGIGLSQTETFLMVLVIAWLFAIALRAKLNKSLDYAQFNAMQVGLAGLTLVALLVLMAAVANGLLGSPDMQIMGNFSTAYKLNWYQDRADAILPQPSLISVPLWLYRGLMLAWALWLAISVLGWLRWGWQAMNVGGVWMSRPPKAPGAGGLFNRKKAVVQPAVNKPPAGDVEADGDYTEQPAPRPGSE